MHPTSCQAVKKTPTYLTCMKISPNFISLVRNDPIFYCPYGAVKRLKRGWIVSHNLFNYLENIADYKKLHSITFTGKFSGFSFEIKFITTCSYASAKNLFATLQGFRLTRYRVNIEMEREKKDEKFQCQLFL